MNVATNDLTKDASSTSKVPKLSLVRNRLDGEYTTKASSSKPTTMSRTSSSEHLHTEIVSSALTFLSRPQLLRLHSVSYRFRSLLKKDFNCAPYLFLHKLESVDTQHWIINYDYCKIERFIELLAESKFVRFNVTVLSWESDHLREISHVCQDAELQIKTFGIDMQQKTFDPLISNCKSLDLIGYQVIQWFPYIPPSDSLQRVSLFDWDHSDHSTADIPEFCVESIVEFLFRPTNKSQELFIGITLSNQLIQAIINAIKKKFLEAITPVAFTLKWIRTLSNNWNLIFSRATKNQRTNQMLRFRRSKRRLLYRLYV